VPDTTVKTVPGNTEPSGPAKSDAPPAGEAPKSEANGQQTFDADYVKKLRDESAKYRTQAKELSAKAKKFDEMEEANKSDLEKAQAAAKAAQEELASANVKALKAQVGASKKLPPSMISRLQGSTEEEMIADADAMLTDINAQYVAKTDASPKDTGAGVSGESADYESKSPKELAEDIQAHRR